MNVVHIITDLDQSGGAQRLVVDMSINKKQFNPHVIILQEPEGDLLDILNNNNIPVIQLSGRKILFGLEGTLERKWGVTPKDTVIHVHLFPCLYIGAFIKKYKKLYTEHSTSNRRRNHVIFAKIEKYIYSKYDQLISISEGVAKSLSNWLLTNNEGYINNGIDLSKYPCTLQKRSIEKENNKNIKLGMLGRLSSQKNQDLIIKAMAYLPDNVELHLGGGGYRYPELKKLANECGVDQKIFFHGYINNSRNFLEDLDVYIQSSHVEGFGLAAIEAMACGLPVIGSDIPGLSDIIGRKDILFNNNSVDSLVTLVKAILKDSRLYGELSEYSFNSSRKYNIVNTVEKYEKIYYEMLSVSQSVSKEG